MFSPCSQGVSSNKNPNRKNMQKQNILLSVTETDSSLGPRALRSCPLLLGGPGGRTIQDGEKAENKFTATSGLPACMCVCVSCVASIYARVCSSVSCVPLKT